MVDEPDPTFGMYQIFIFNITNAADVIQSGYGLRSLAISLTFLNVCMYVCMYVYILNVGRFKFNRLSSYLFIFNIQQIPFLILTVVIP